MINDDEEVVKYKCLYCNTVFKVVVLSNRDLWYQEIYYCPFCGAEMLQVISEEV